MSTRVKLLASFASFLLACLALTPAAALASDSKTLPNGPVTGLVVRYVAGTLVRNAQGQAEVSNFSPFVLHESRALGAGLHEVAFVHPTTLEVAQRVATAVTVDPTVVSVSPNFYIKASSVSRVSQKPASVIKVSSAVRPSAVRQLRAIDTWNANSRFQSSVKLTWKKPDRLAGAKFVNYSIFASLDGGSKFIAVKATKQRSFSIRNLQVGTKYLFKIFTVVKKGDSYYRGVHHTISFNASAAPRPPVLNTAQLIQTTSVVSWQAQSRQQSGGLKTSYRVEASAGSETVGCETTGNSCTIQLDPVFGGYQVSVTATNAKGSTSNLLAPNIADPLYSKQWYLNGQNGINAENAWAKTRGTGKVTVAVIDTGITNHPDFSKSLILDANGHPYGYDFVSGIATSGDGNAWDSDPTDPGDYSANSDSSWHGTDVTGLIAATHNQVGIAGVAPNIGIVSVRALGSSGGSLSDLLAAVNWASGISVAGTETNLHPAQVINLSLASDSNLTCDSTSQTLFRHIAQLGTIVVSAAGNRSTDAVNSFPANCASVVSVAATNRRGDLASYSNFGSLITVAAPGGDVTSGIITTTNTGKTIAASDGYSSDFGTSLAAPLVTGAIALMLSVNPSLREAEVIKILRESATEFGLETKCAINPVCGPGILNVAAAVELADLLNN